jgi:hypothetical protein
MMDIKIGEPADRLDICSPRPQSRTRAHSLFRKCGRFSRTDRETTLSKLKKTAILWTTMERNGKSASQEMRKSHECVEAEGHSPE